MLSTFLASSKVSSLANASHKSTSKGQHSTALCNNNLASSSFANSTTAFHNLTESGTFSSPLRNTLLLFVSSCSNFAACNHNLTEFGIIFTPLAMTALASSGLASLQASNQTSSFFGHSSQPFFINCLAAATFPATSSNLAAAIQPGGCFGLV
ncbi:hypothetical protein CISIN_1g031831mg [Citrus sinensis]|uniref:Uncharacterized protein n=1 Tax=Citrus sinensis TaxID=2711 RepID=A0A067D704_CITSI|nr:hypothetical protein CISIN_1g031831mg [Citrus sinensis]